MNNTKQHNLLGLILAAVTGASLLTARILCTFLPRIILPRLDIPMLVLLSSLVLVIDHYFCHGSKRNYILLPLYAALVFGLFPYTAGFTTPMESLILGITGAILFTVVTFLFDTMNDRMSGNPFGKITPVLGAGLLYLASQCLTNIII